MTDSGHDLRIVVDISKALGDNVVFKRVGMLQNVMDQHAPKDAVVNGWIIEETGERAKETVSIARHWQDDHLHLHSLSTMTFSHATEKRRR